MLSNKWLTFVYTLLWNENGISSRATNFETIHYESKYINTIISWVIEIDWRSIYCLKALWLWTCRVFFLLVSTVGIHRIWMKKNSILNSKQIFTSSKDVSSFEFSRFKNLLSNVFTSIFWYSGQKKNKTTWT